MLAIGLTPTPTGREGGSLTGQHVAHLITANGKFAVAAATLLRAHPAILYQDRAEELQNPTHTRKAASKTRYTCPVCTLHAWAKPGARLLCGTCREAMQADS